MMKKNLSLLPPSLMAASLGLCLLGGCTLGPNFVKPDPRTPESWNDPSVQAADGDRVTTQADPDPKWWLGFNDPTLSSLIERATQGNLDVQIAVVRIAEARTSVRSAESQGLPKVNGKLAYTRATIGSGVLGGAASDPSSSSSALSGILGSLTQPVDVYQGALDLSWELDFFGRVRRSVEAAGAATDAAVGNRDDALVMMQAEVAQSYAQLRAAQASRQTAQADYDSQQQVLGLTQARASQGLVTDLDVENAKASLAATEASLAQYDNQIASSLNGLAVLLGEPPGALEAELSAVAPIPPVPPQVPLGLPSGLARRRPDIRVAEAKLHQQTASIGVAVAQFYPQVSLTGQLQQIAMHPGDLANWANHFASFGPSISLPIFQGGQLKANLDLAKANQVEAALTYRKTVLGALQDVENALAAYRTELRRNKALEKNVAAQAAALEIARSQYIHGVTTFINVLTAQNALAQQRQALIQSSLLLTTDVVNLYKALGGGWQ
jgi:NodT family efflux transporter outer membrane factor (OMF) lipoprotein